MLVPLLTLALTSLDQVTKAVVHARFGLGESVAVIPGFFHLTYVRNTGAAWGMFSGFSAWLTLISLLALILIIVFRNSLISDSLRHRLAFACILSGVTGNLLDRLRYGYVIDFLDFHFGNYQFPVFNIADSVICIGAGLYLLDMLFFGGIPPAADR